jgi:hypothetical protein
VVRKYINGTRSRHRKITSIMMDEEFKGPDEKGMWAVKGSYVTDDGHKEPFNASVTPRGEVLLTITAKTNESSEKRPLRYIKKRFRPSIKRNEAM